MAHKELPLAESPIRGYMMYSYHLSVTFAHVNALPWFYTNFVQLQCDPAQLALTEFLKFTNMPKGEIHFTEGTSRYNPWLSECMQVAKAELVLLPSVSQYVVDALDEGCYVETFIDEYFLPELFNGGSLHFRHRLLIYGHSGNTRRFKIVGFDKKKLYRKLECSFDEFEQAFNSVTPQIFETTKLFKPHESAHLSLGFDREKFCGVMRDYLASRNTFLNPDLHGSGSNNKFCYGASAYDFLQNYISAVIDKNVVRPDIRGFHVFLEHKKCMSERLKWLHTMGYPVDADETSKYRRVVTLCELARNRIVAYARGFAETGSTEKYLSEISRYLQEARSIEAALLEKLLANLSH